MLDDLIELALELIFEGTMESVTCTAEAVIRPACVGGHPAGFVCRCDRTDGVGRDLDPKLAVDRVGSGTACAGRGACDPAFSKEQGTPQPPRPVMTAPVPPD